jgi:predicted transcriptional regulator
VTEQTQIHVGETAAEVGARFIDAWHRMARGEAVREKHVSFADWETMLRTLSPERLALLRHLHHHPARTVRALAEALGRDQRRVQEDVAVLEAAGLLDRDAAGLRAEYDGFDLRMRITL